MSSMVLVRKISGTAKTPLVWKRLTLRKSLDEIVITLNWSCR
jgi:hypothetical protein